MPFVPGPTVLEGRHVRLEPLAESHVAALFAAGGGDDEVWRRLNTQRSRCGRFTQRQPGGVGVEVGGGAGGVGAAGAAM